MQKEIYFAAGCFWGAEQFFKLLNGVSDTEVGFANGHTRQPTYEEVYTDTTGYAETVRVRYESELISLPTMVSLFFKIIDPTSLNRQGHDVGTRYRTGVYYADKRDLPVIRAVRDRVARAYKAPLQVEVEPIACFFPAEERHQDYLDKNPTGYCHLPLGLLAEARQYKPIRTIIRERLFELRDTGYRDFHSKLVPGLDADCIIGVRVPDLRNLAKAVAKDPDIGEFLLELPHRYYEENNLHGIVLSEGRDYDSCVAALDQWLPYVDNWATCDMVRPKVFRRHHDRLLDDIRRWMGAKHTYTVRFGIEMLMTHFLEDDFRPDQLEWVAVIRHEDYYVKMMAGWYFATALAKQYEAVLPYVERRRLAPDVHRMTVRKALESFRITEEQKAVLRRLR